MAQDSQAIEQWQVIELAVMKDLGAFLRKLKATFEAGQRLKECTIGLNRPTFRLGPEEQRWTSSAGTAPIATPLRARRCPEPCCRSGVFLKALQWAAFGLVSDSGLKDRLRFEGQAPV